MAGSDKDDAFIDLGTPGEETFPHADLFQATNMLMRNNSNTNEVANHFRALDPGQNAPMLENNAIEAAPRTLLPVAKRKKRYYRGKEVRYNAVTPNRVAIPISRQQYNDFSCCKRRDCKELFTFEECQASREEYGGIPKAIDRRAYIQNRIDEDGYRVRNKSVCVLFFLWVFNISRNMATRNKKRKNQDGSVSVFALPRVLHTVDAKEQAVVHWLQYQAKFHDKQPDRDEVHLPFSSRVVLWKLYASEARLQPHLLPTVSLSWFRKIMSIRCPNIKLRKHLRFAKCDFCVEKRDARAKSLDPKVHEAIRLELNEHYKLIKQERQAYYDKRTKAKKFPERCLSIIMDGADQSIYQLPYFYQASKTTSAALKNNCHIEGVIVHGREVVRLYTVLDNWAHDSNMVWECLHRTLRAVEAQNRIGLPDVLYIQGDNTTREMKNQFFFGNCAMLVLRGVFMIRKIRVSFLPVGHTHEDIDQLFSRMAVYMKGNNLLSRDELDRLATCYSPRPVVEHVNAIANTKELVQRSGEAITGHTVPHLFKIVKDNDGNVVMWTKDWHHDAFWMGDTRTVGFSLLKKDRAQDISSCLPAVKKPIESAVLAGMRSGLEKCRPRMDEPSYQCCLKDINLLADTSDIPFHWLDDGKYQKEATLAIRERERALPDAPPSPVRPEPEGHLRHKRGAARDNTPLQVGDMIAVKADLTGSSKEQPFWIAQVLTILQKNGEKYVKVHWYSAKRTNGAYTEDYLIVNEEDVERQQSSTSSGKRKRNKTSSNVCHVPSMGEVEVATILCWFDRLNKNHHLPKRIVTLLKAHESLTWSGEQDSDAESNSEGTTGSSEEED